jgi:hypothetical protein
VVQVGQEADSESYLMLADSFQELEESPPRAGPHAFFLPALDPFIMGYRDRRRFLTPQHQGKIFDRAGNAVPTVWANGRVVGAWGQRTSGDVVYGLFEPVGGDEGALIEEQRHHLQGFLQGEYIPSRMHTSFTRGLE